MSVHEHISKPEDQTSQNFWRMLPVALASSDGGAKNGLPVLWMTSC